MRSPGNQRDDKALGCPPLRYAHDFEALRCQLLGVVEPAHTYALRRRRQFEGEELEGV